MGKFKKALLKFVEEFQKDRISERGATLAFYALYVMAPILLIVVSVGGVLFGQETVKRGITTFIEQRVGAETGAVLIEMVENMAGTDIDIFMFVVGLSVMFYGLYLMFEFLRRSFFEIFGVEFRSPKDIRQTFRRYAVSIVYAVLIFILVILLLTVNIATPWLFRFSGEMFGGILGGVLPFIQFLVVLVLTSGLLAVTYRTVSAKTVSVGSAFLGGTVAAFLFALLNILLAVYFAFTEVYTTYGAAGSLVAFLFWVYFVAQVLFIGAQVAKVYQRVFGPRKKLEPEPLMEV